MYVGEGLAPPVGEDIILLHGEVKHSIITVGTGVLDGPPFQTTQITQSVFLRYNQFPTVRTVEDDGPYILNEPLQSFYGQTGGNYPPLRL